jgi:hypothetical protein
LLSASLLAVSSASAAFTFTSGGEQRRTHCSLTSDAHEQTNHYCQHNQRRDSAEKERSET